MGSNTHDTIAPNKRHKVESAANHYYSYILSIILTMLAFAVVIYGGLDRAFILIFLVGLATAQSLVQLFFWMHAKDRGHFMPLLFLFGGLIIALTGVVAAVYWMWW